MSEARNAILQSIGKGKAAARPVPDYTLPEASFDAPAQFAAKAKASVAHVHEIASPDDAPVRIWSIITEAKLQPRLHIFENSPVMNLPWHRAPGVTLTPAPPTGVDSAFSTADYAIAETGTLAFFSGPRSPSSWHFRPGREFVLIGRATILPRLEDVIGLLAAEGAMPATLNLITGPSRTADIEQTIELGAHGPRELHILIAG